LNYGEAYQLSPIILYYVIITDTTSF